MNKGKSSCEYFEGLPYSMLHYNKDNSVDRYNNCPLYVSTIPDQHNEKIWAMHAGRCWFVMSTVNITTCNPPHTY